MLHYSLPYRHPLVTRMNPTTRSLPLKQNRRNQTLSSAGPFMRERSPTLQNIALQGHLMWNFVCGRYGRRILTSWFVSTHVYRGASTHEIILATECGRRKLLHRTECTAESVQDDTWLWIDLGQQYSRDREC